MHSAVENPILESSISNKAINHFKDQLIMCSSKDCNKIQIKREKYCDKNTLTISFPHINTEPKFLTPSKRTLIQNKHTLYISTSQLPLFFVSFLQRYFKNAAFKITLNSCNTCRIAKYDGNPPSFWMDTLAV